MGVLCFQIYLHFLTSLNTKRLIRETDKVKCLLYKCIAHSLTIWRVAVRAWVPIVYACLPFKTKNVYESYSKLFLLNARIPQKMTVLQIWLTLSVL